jgi:hypothetical protein
MSLSGADIVLTDHNRGLTNLIDITAEGIITEVRRTAGYYGISNTCVTSDGKTVWKVVL